MKIILKLLLISILFASCKTQNIYESKTATNDQSTFMYDASYQYKIRKDDKISISVWGEDNLSVGSTYGIYNSNEVYGKWLMVDAYGNIEVPKIGTKNVLNKTVPELKEEIKMDLKKWLVNPILDIKVLNKEITVLGEVKSPNAIKVDTDNVTLLQIISKAGGIDSYANLKCVKILRQEGENVRVTNLDLTTDADILNTNVILHPGDVVIVPSKKNKEFDKRISVIIPFTTAITAASIVIGLF
ncbi:polysaccharide biosynthesis/export family protein [Flavobacterium nackdongense]|uniref:Polysaccharide export protein n=1 Tax=Flavobacterium nackdongense TaxID=2547394 RepID=A0A4P6YB48_9FLAO|nr:polysaccharide biosynthesis/export family protein [Flavobacterium nackdongense]QBN17520.1 polysaccharide export protein [Flavobacterium nackdongense]